MNVNMKWDKSLSAKFKNLRKNGQELLDSEVLKSSNVFIPTDSHELMRSSLRATSFGSGKIIWDVPYARRLYWNPSYNFSTDVNPKASGMWYEKAKAQDLGEWIKMLEALQKKII